jgi:copper chaperone
MGGIMTGFTLKIDGMHCGGCVDRVTNALKKVDGVEVGTVEVGSAVVRYDPARTSEAALRAAVEKLGFQVL